MTGQPHDLRPDPYAEGGGWREGGDPVPSSAVVEREYEDSRRLAAKYPAPQLEVGTHLHICLTCPCSRGSAAVASLGLRCSVQPPVEPGLA